MAKKMTKNFTALRYRLHILGWSHLNAMLFLVNQITRQ